MADRVEEGGEFLLPSEFLTDEDILGGTEFCFPTEFPYDVDSVVNSSDEEDQLTELTRQLSLQHSHKPHVEKSRWVMAGSPQSTLMGSWSGQSPGSSNGGSPNGPSQVSSPPTTPFGANNNAFDLIHQAAGQVAKLKTNGGDASSARNRGHCVLEHSNAFYNTYGQRMRDEQRIKQQQQLRMAQNRGIRFGALMENEQVGAWPSLQYMQQQNSPVTRAVVFNGGGSGNVGGVKKQCAGTGVFLPRPYSTNPAESRKKPGCSTAWIPARVVHALDRKFNNMNGGLVQPQPLPCFGGGYNVDYHMLETLMARRNALLIQQRRNLRQRVAVNREISLPQEWTY